MLSDCFLRFDQSIALFDLALCRGQDATESPEAKILLTGNPGEQIGFLVTKVVGIETSEWREVSAEGSPAQGTHLVQLGSGDTASILPVFDLLGMRQHRSRGARHRSDTENTGLEMIP